MAGITGTTADLSPAPPSGLGAVRPAFGMSLGTSLGLLIVALFPAAFWVGVIHLAAPLFGFAVTAGDLLAIGAGIALFLSFVFAGLMMVSAAPRD
ncbi:MAG: hypothetical protein NW205_08095 [Hyphomicrobiaceae bacterium]|nr:hypothetical protein [Hyphomicrobiaceae bacterium]